MALENAHERVVRHARSERRRQPGGVVFARETHAEEAQSPRLTQADDTTDVHKLAREVDHRRGVIRAAERIDVLVIERDPSPREALLVREKGMLGAHEPAADAGVAAQRLQIEMPRLAEELIVGVVGAEVVAIDAVGPMRGNVLRVALEVPIADRERREVRTRGRRATPEDGRQLIRRLRDDDHAAIAIVVRVHGRACDERLRAQQPLGLAATSIVARLSGLDNEKAANDAGPRARVNGADDPDRRLPPLAVARIVRRARLHLDVADDLPLALHRIPRLRVRARRHRRRAEPRGCERDGDTPRETGTRCCAAH